MDRITHKNGLVKKELFLLKPFAKEPWKEFTISEIKKISKNKSHHYVFEALKKFTRLEILKETKTGNTNTYIVNTESINPYLDFTESLIKEERTDIPYKNINSIAKKIKNPFYILLIGGSYAENRQKPTSDMDVAIIIPNTEQKKPYQTALKEGELMVPEIHGFVFTQDEFYLMLANDEFNYGKELAKKHIIIHGAEPYYKMLFEAIKHGFKG